MRVSACIHMCGMCVCVCVRIYMCVCVCVCVHMHLHEYVCMCTLELPYMCSFLNVYTRGKRVKWKGWGGNKREILKYLNVNLLIMY